jgi:uncharacterized protein (DUF342 family)
MGFQQNHTPDERKQAMVIYAANLGRAELVEKQLAEVGLDVKIGTLRSWIHRDKDLYEQIRTEYEAVMRREMAEGFYGTAALAREVGEEALIQMRDALERGEVSLKELPKVAQSALIAAGVATDKGQLLSGQPTENVRTDFGDIQRELASVGIQVIVNGAGEAERPPVKVSQSPPALPASTD